MKKNKSNDNKKKEEILISPFEKQKISEEILKLEKEGRDRLDISSTFIGLLGAGAFAFLTVSIKMRRDILHMFSLLFPFLVFYKSSILLNICHRIEEKEALLGINTKFYKRKPFCTFFHIVLFIFIVLAIFDLLDKYIPIKKS